MIEVYYSREFYRESILYQRDTEAWWSDGVTSGFSKFQKADNPDLDSYDYIKLFEIYD